MIDVGTIILLVWLAGTMGFLLPIAKWCLSMWSDGPESDDYKLDVVLAIITALTTSWCWPLLIPGWWMYKVITS